MIGNIKSLTKESRIIIGAICVVFQVFAFCCFKGKGPFYFIIVGLALVTACLFIIHFKRASQPDKSTLICAALFFAVAVINFFNAMNW